MTQIDQIGQYAKANGGLTDEEYSVLFKHLTGGMSRSQNNVGMPQMPQGNSIGMNVQRQIPIQQIQVPFVPVAGGMMTGKPIEDLDLMGKIEEFMGDDEGGGEEPVGGYQEGGLMDGVKSKVMQGILAYFGMG